jgi:hypothetical protein
MVRSSSFIFIILIASRDPTSPSADQADLKRISILAHCLEIVFGIFITFISKLASRKHVERVVIARAIMYDDHISICDISIYGYMIYDMCYRYII